MPKVAYRCTTLQNAQDFIYNAIKQDWIVWRSAYWDNEDFCFCVNCDKYGQVRLMYSHVKFLLYDGYQIQDYVVGSFDVSKICINFYEV